MKMNKIIIPSIVAATLLVIGVVGFAPVEQATAVHTTIQGTQLNDVGTSVTLTLGTDVNVQCANAFLVHYSISADADADAITIDFDDDAADELTFIIEVDDAAAGFATGSTELSGTLGGKAADNVEFTATTGTPNAIITGVCQSGDTVAFS